MPPYVLPQADVRVVTHLVRCKVNPAVGRGQLKETFPCVIGWRLANVGDQALHS